jgi:hypothetical protein
MQPLSRHAEATASLSNAQQLSLRLGSPPLVITGLDPVICSSTVP